MSAEDGSGGCWPAAETREETGRNRGQRKEQQRQEGRGKEEAEKGGTEREAV